MKKKILTGVIALSLCLQGETQQAGEKTEGIHRVERWVEVSQIIAEERSEWEEKKEILSYKIGLLQNETKVLDQQIAVLLEEAAASERKRAEKREEEARLRAASRVVEKRVCHYEKKIVEIAKSFPKPLLDKVGPQLVQVSQEEQNPPLAVNKRLALVVDILNEVDKFNGNTTVVSELQEVSSGEIVEVKTLYLGLAQAFFVDSEETHAAIGTPSKNGWKWIPHSELAHKISRAIAMKENLMKPAEFIELPVTLP